MSSEALVKGSWPLAHIDDAGRLCRHDSGTNPPQYVYDAAFEALWQAGEALRMKHEQAIKLAIEALHKEIATVQIHADLHDVFSTTEPRPGELLAMDFRTPITERASKRRADCRAAIDALQHPTAEQSSFLEAA